MLIPSKNGPIQSKTSMFGANLLIDQDSMAGSFLFSGGFLILHITPHPLVISPQSTRDRGLGSGTQGHWDIGTKRQG